MAEKSVEARKLKGFRDYLPESAVTRAEIIGKVRHTAYQAGFLPIETPSLEYADVLIGTSNSETDKEVYCFEDHGKRKVGLRFDLTVPFARFVTEHFNELIMPFKRFQVGEVWRGEKPQKGRYRQFCQADIDIIGVDSTEADVELLSTFIQALEKIVPSRTTLKLNHRGLLSALIRHFLRPSSKEHEVAIIMVIDKLAKLPTEAIKEQISQHTAASCEQVDQLLSVIQMRHQDLSDLRNLLPEQLPELDRFEHTFELISELGPYEQLTPVTDLSLARGLGYYTGLVFEATLDDHPEIGSIGGGGRYNQLVARFGKHELAGVGGAIGVDRLLLAIENLKQPQGETKKRSGYFIAIATPDARNYAFKICRALRTRGVPTDIAVKTTKLNQQFRFADRRRYHYVVTVGSDEVNTQTCSIKNLATEQQERGVALQKLLETASPN